VQKKKRESWGRPSQGTGNVVIRYRPWVVPGRIRKRGNQTSVSKGGGSKGRLRQPQPKGEKILRRQYFSMGGCSEKKEGYLARMTPIKKRILKSCPGEEGEEHFGLLRPYREGRTPEAPAS